MEALVVQCVRRHFPEFRSSNVSLTAEPLTGGLTNRLYTVDVRCRSCAPHEPLEMSSSAASSPGSDCGPDLSHMLSVCSGSLASTQPHLPPSSPTSSHRDVPSGGSPPSEPTPSTSVSGSGSRPIPVPTSASKSGGHHPRSELLCRVVVRVFASPGPTGPEALGERPTTYQQSHPQSVFTSRDRERAVLAAVSAARISPQMFAELPLVPPSASASASASAGPGSPTGRDGGDSDDGDDSVITPSAVSQWGEYKVRLEQYAPGPSITADDMAAPDVMPHIARTLARMHRVPLDRLDLPPGPPSPLYDRLLPTVARMALFAASNGVGISPVMGDGPSVPPVSLSAVLDGVDVMSEVEWMLRVARESESPVVLAHGDAQPGNWLRLKTEGATTPSPSSCPHASKAADLARSLLFRATDDCPLVLIDYEYADANYRGYDFANHFVEYTFDYHNPEYPFFFYHPDKYPSDEYQTAFFTAYLGADASPANVAALKRETFRFKGASALLWALWSVSMALSDMAEAFAYIPYAKCRFEEYFMYKAQIIEADATAHSKTAGTKAATTPTTTTTTAAAAAAAAAATTAATTTA